MYYELKNKYEDTIFSTLLTLYPLLFPIVIIPILLFIFSPNVGYEAILWSIPLILVILLTFLMRLKALEKTRFIEGVYVDKNNKKIALKYLGKQEVESYNFSEINFITSHINKVRIDSMFEASGRIYRRYYIINIVLKNGRTVKIRDIRNYKSFFSVICSLEGLVKIQNSQEEYKEKKFFEDNILKYRETGRFTFEAEHPYLHAILFLAALAPGVALIVMVIICLFRQ